MTDDSSYRISALRSLRVVADELAHLDRMIIIGTSPRQCVEQVERIEGWLTGVRYAMEQADEAVDP